MKPSPYAIRAQGLRKRFGRAEALAGFDLEVRAGTVHGLLGPNGAGKTTVVRILTTLLRPDEGHAEVAGFDIVRQARQVRAQIGLTGQYAAVDEVLTGRQNLTMFGRLLHLGAQGAARRADELLERFSLTDAAHKPVKQYSGGMRRRLDLAAGMILAPRVLFLDEPTTGLDPRSRNEVWQAVRSLVAGGTTVLLTTQYLDEADKLAHRIAVIDHGRVVADDTPGELKGAIGGDRVEVVLHDQADVPAATRILVRACGTEPEVDAEERRLHAPVVNRVATLTEVLRTLEDQGIGVADIGLRRPTLDEVFLHLTGRRAEQSAPGGGPAEPAGTDPAGQRTHKESTVA
ncbi:ABC transporter [Wenjunlia vitaminophila]|uniref:ABC-type xenobiotic transporter n=1 Tax=Wenjunlia vitaminophila TaxID=76728 RepID=A0A0T6LWW1_WENVI|nr:daunorubicin resistance protein DrrA family ABC transporter ATP-binding protein [Wenjunlia vitaminophila]KRV50554.1 ABC transporter [Wenjunlia vitaminophila]